MGKNEPESIIETGAGVIEVFSSETLRTESMSPVGYRLARKPNGEVVLQGAYEWGQGSYGGYEWRDIETVEL